MSEETVQNLHLSKTCYSHKCACLATLDFLLILYQFDTVCDFHLESCV